MKKRKNLDRFYWDKRSDNSSSSKAHKARSYSTLGSTTIITPPSKCAIFTVESHREFVKFIRTIESKATNSKRIVLDFNSCEIVKAPCLVTLYATLEELLNDNPKLSFKIQDFEAAEQVKTAIKNCGFKRIGNKALVDYDFKNVEILPIQNNRTAEVDDIVDYIQYSVMGGDLTVEQENILAQAVEEAILNVRHHAYPDGDSVEKKWWVITELIDNTQFYLAIYDRGAGIPDRAPKTDWIKELGRFDKFLKAKLLGASDEQMIDLAMELSKSRTGYSERGLGSKSIRELVETNPEGELFVFSGKGGYSIDETGNKELHAYKTPLKGTLVQWNIEI